MAVLRQLGAVSVETANSNVGSNILLFTAGGSEQIIVGTIWFANKSGQTVTVEFAHVPSADTLANKHWKVPPTSVATGLPQVYQMPITMAAGDKLYVKVTGVTTSYCSVTADGVVNP